MSQKYKTIVVILLFILSAALIIVGYCWGQRSVGVIVPSSCFEKAYPILEVERQYHLKNLSMLTSALSHVSDSSRNQVVVISKYRIPYYQTRAIGDIALAFLDANSKAQQGWVFVYDQAKMKERFREDVGGPKFVFLPECW